MTNIASNRCQVLLTPELVGLDIVSVLTDKAYQEGLALGFPEKGLLKSLNIPAAKGR